VSVKAEDESIDEGSVWPFHSDTCRWNRGDPTVGEGRQTADGSDGGRPASAPRADVWPAKKARAPRAGIHMETWRRRVQSKPWCDSVHARRGTVRTGAGQRGRGPGRAAPRTGDGERPCCDRGRPARGLAVISGVITASVRSPLWRHSTEGHKQAHEIAVAAL
jgi:hypothetical protein